MSDSVTPWTVAHQAPLSMGFSRQEYWIGLPFPSPGKSHLENTTIHLDLHNPALKLPRYTERNAQRECQGTKGTRKLVKSQKGRWETPAHTPVEVPSVGSDSVTPWTVAHQAPLSMGFSRQQYWSELAFPTPGDLPSPRIEPLSLWSSPVMADS